MAGKAVEFGGRKLVKSMKDFPHEKFLPDNSWKLSFVVSLLPQQLLFLSKNTILQDFAACCGVVWVVGLPVGASVGM